MGRMLSRPRTLGIVTACMALAICLPQRTAAQDLRQQGTVAVSVKTVAAQVGARVQPREDDDLGLGASFTAMLEEPDKLAEFGIKGMHVGARVTVARVAPDRVRIEVDEMEPVPARGSTTVKLNGKGGVTAPAKS